MAWGVDLVVGTVDTSGLRQSRGWGPWGCGSGRVLGRSGGL